MTADDDPPGQMYAERHNLNLNVNGSAPRSACLPPATGRTSCHIAPVLVSKQCVQYLLTASQMGRWEALVLYIHTYCCYRCPVCAIAF